MKAILYKNRAELFVLNGNKRPIRYEFQNGVKVISLNRQEKSGYFNEISNSDSSRPFWFRSIWQTCSPYFSNKHARGDSKIMLIENDKMQLKN